MRLTQEIATLVVCSIILIGCSSPEATNIEQARQLLSWQQWLIIGLVAFVLFLLTYIGSIHVRKHILHNYPSDQTDDLKKADTSSSENTNKDTNKNQQNAQELQEISNQVNDLLNRFSTKTTITQAEEETLELTKEQIEEARQELMLNQEDRDARLFRRLKEMIVDQRLYLDPNLSRDMLLRKAHIQKAQFSPIFKKYANKSFTQFVNELRLKHAIELMKIHEDYTIDAIAMESGMGSIQSFYRIFTERYGVAPNEYRKILMARKMKEAKNNP